MPLPRLRTLLLLLSLLTLLLLVCYLSFTSFLPNSPLPSSSSAQRGHWQTTSSFLFPASAVISLSDDNNTFFISRPAAFGPPLPHEGMEGELFVLEEGQLACDDTPGWDPSASHPLVLDKPPPTQTEVEDDGTDDILNPTVAATLPQKTGSGHADIESLQQSAEIGGKIVLVSRGGCGFLEKVLWTQRRGGVALIVGDYKRAAGGIGGGLVTMYAKGDTSNVTIPSIFTSHMTAALLTSLLPKPAPIPLLRPYKPAHHPRGERTGLWITLTPTTMTSSPFFDTLLVLVVSPLVTLTVVYALLLIRSRIRRRRWRAPKSVVQRLPVRTYHPELRYCRRGWSGSSECVVCLEEYQDGVSRVMRLPCGHEFHVECITPWLTTRRRTCPICKGDVVRGARSPTTPITTTTTPVGPGVDETTPLVVAPDDDDSDEDVEVGMGD